MITNKDVIDSAEKFAKDFNIPVSVAIVIIRETINSVVEKLDDDLTSLGASRQ